jgi:histidine triad (HIT) family protein
MAEPDFDKMSPEEIAEYQRQNCIFCKIIKGEIPSRKAYEDEKLVAIMDINPAAKGHLLLMPKEHYPVLPIIPPELSAQMFRLTRELSSAVKKAMITDKATIFIANGGVAGQQSPHFLYHIIPRENNDGLDNFNIPSKEVTEEEIAGIMPVIKGKLGLMMRSYYSQFRKPVEKKPEWQAGPEAAASSAASKQPVIQGTGISGSGAGAGPLPSVPRKPLTQQELAKFIFDNPKIKEKIIADPDGFKNEIESNPELKVLFSGISIHKLAEALRRIG